MLRLTLYECVVKICIQGWFLIRKWIFRRIICRTMKNKDVNAIEPRKTKGAKKDKVHIVHSCESSCCITCM